MKKHSAQSVVFIDRKGKEHVAIVIEKRGGDMLDLKYREDSDIVYAYDIPKMTDKTKRLCWK